MHESFSQLASETLERCRILSGCTETPGAITRTFLCPSMRDAHAFCREWMTQSGMETRVDAVGNIRGVYPGRTPDAPRLYIASHLDTVPNAGQYDGILGVLMGLALVKALGGKRLGISIEVIGFSEEEGVRFGVPFIGSRAFAGTADEALLSRKDASGKSVRDAVADYGLDLDLLPAARYREPAAGYLEFHIEQGPVLEHLGLPLGVVEAIVGQSRFEFVFEGKSNHAGTTPMRLRQDALSAAAEWIVEVEQEALRTAGLVATVGKLTVSPGAGNVIAGNVLASLDARHADDAVREAAVARLTQAALDISAKRGVSVQCRPMLTQASAPMDARLVQKLCDAVSAAGLPLHRMNSGAGHDAMIVAPCMPAVMLFLRSPGGISHHPDESVAAEDVEAGLRAGLDFLYRIENEIVLQS